MRSRSRQPAEQRPGLRKQGIPASKRDTRSDLSTGGGLESGIRPSPNRLWTGDSDGPAPPAEQVRRHLMISGCLYGGLFNNAFAFAAKAINPRSTGTAPLQTAWRTLAHSCRICVKLLAVQP